VSAPDADGVRFVSDDGSEAAYVSETSVATAVARAAAESLRKAGWTVSIARNDLDAPDMQWIYVGWAGTPEPS
jgi:hypothetical protein